MSWYIDAIKNYVNFSGRARRKAYWMFYLMHIVVTVVVVVLNMVIFGLEGMPVLTTIYGLFILLPGLAVAIRRLHDIGKSGWWYLIGFVPIIGIIWLIVLLATAGNSGDNQYGPDPKAAPEA